MNYSHLEELKRNNIIDQLNKLNITENVHDMSYAELRRTLTIARLKSDEDVLVESNWFGGGWF